jgi:hypothetical protein
MTKIICRLTPEIDAKRVKRTGLQIEHWQPRPDHLPSGGDCAVRSACWATGEDYETVFAELQERTNRVKRRNYPILKHGTPLSAIRSFYEARGWSWVPVKGQFKTTEKVYGGGLRGRITERVNVLFKAENLPKKPCVAITTRHAVAVEDHVVVDSYDSRGDRSCILEGYFVKKDN